MRNVRELIRFGDGGARCEGDWLLIDGVSLRASVSRLGSLSPQAISSIAERKAAGATPGAKVVAAALALVKSGTVVKGGCWDWVNRAYNDAGYPAKKRRAVFQSKPEGPYVNAALIRPGDWISFRNLTYGEIGHSALFVDWIDFERHSAITLEYAGENREMPGPLPRVRHLQVLHRDAPRGVRPSAVHVREIVDRNLPSDIMSRKVPESSSEPATSHVQTAGRPAPVKGGWRSREWRSCPGAGAGAACVQAHDRST